MSPVRVRALSCVNLNATFALVSDVIKAIRARFRRSSRAVALAAQEQPIANFLPVAARRADASRFVTRAAPTRPGRALALEGGHVPHGARGAPEQHTEPRQEPSSNPVSLGDPK